MKCTHTENACEIEKIKKFGCVLCCYFFLGALHSPVQFPHASYMFRLERTRYCSPPLKYASVGSFFSLITFEREREFEWVIVYFSAQDTKMDENMMNKQIRTDSNRIQNNNRSQNTEMWDARKITIGILVYLHSAKAYCWVRSHTHIRCRKNKETNQNANSKKEEEKHRFYTVKQSFPWCAFFWASDFNILFCV